MSHYLKKIKRHTLLEKSFNYIIEKNKSTNLPYHNTRHLIKVFNSAIVIADKMGLNEIQIIELGIACLFHDINHSGGKLTDKENIAIAIDEFNSFRYSIIDEFNDLSTINIINMILCTEFPKTKEPDTLQQRIIMDCDLLQCYDIDWFIYAIKGLSMERGISISKALSDQINFINTVVFYTDYAQKLQKKNNKKYSKKLEYLKTIFN
jgi:hypothetical protein